MLAGIPAQFHRVWFGGPMPDEFVEYGRTWEQLHPEWTMRLWSEENLFPLENQDLFDHAAAIAPRHAHQLRSDIARLEILWRHGGIYVDTDFECRRSIEPLLAGIDAFAAWEDQGRWINNAILGARARHPFVSRMIDALPDSVRTHPGARPAVMTGPQLLTRLWRSDPMGIHVFDQELFYPYSWRELDRGDEEFPAAYAVHHWNNRRCGR